jgi:hypothetical protein
MDSLRKLGYTTLTIPAENVKPFTLLSRTARGVVGNLNDTLDEIWEPVNRAVPAVSEDFDMVEEISGFDNLNLNVQANFSFLQALTKLFSSNLLAALKFDRTNEIKFKLENPKINNISVIKLDAFLKDAKLSVSSDLLIKTIQNEELYVVTEILKAASFSIEKDMKNETGGEIDVPLKDIVNLDTNVSVKKGKNTLITYSGNKFLTFGFKAYKIICKGDARKIENLTFQLRATDDQVVYKGEEEFPGILLQNESVEL